MWVLKCNPDTWDVSRFLADGHSIVHSWVVQDNYRSHLMTQLNPVVLWVTGHIAGVRGVGYVTGRFVLDLLSISGRRTTGSNRANGRRGSLGAHRGEVAGNRCSEGNRQGRA